MEAKLHFYQTPYLTYAGMTPFVYASLYTVNPASLASAQLIQATRGAVGFGLGWNTIFGRVEFAYASKVWSKPGDVPAEFSVLFSLS